MASEKLNLIKAVSTVEQPPVNLPPDTPNFLKDYPSLANGMGKYKGEPIRIHVDESFNQWHNHIIVSLFMSRIK